MPDSLAKRKWMKENTINVAAKLNKNTDSDILNYLEGKSNATIIKAAIREYMANHPSSTEHIQE